MLEDQMPLNESVVSQEEISDAKSSAQAANEAAVAATAAAINQGQIIDIVTSAAREDAERARSSAEDSAKSSEHAAEISRGFAEEAITKIQLLMTDFDVRLKTLENKPSEPIVVNQQDEVSSINPEDNENSDRQESMSDENKKQENVSIKKKHGRRRR